MSCSFMRGFRTGCLALLAALAVGGGPGSASAGPVFELEHDLVVDGAVTGQLLATLVAIDLLQNRIGPDSCRWCRSNGLDDSLRDSLRWSDTGLAATLSNYTGFVALPVLALGLNALAASLDGRPGAALLDTLIIAESTLATIVLTTVVKLLTARQRPFARDLTPAELAAVQKPGGTNLSFFSGHASMGFAIAVSAGTVASLRGYRWAPLVWAVAMPLAAITSYLRVAADQHYFSDIFLGSLVGGFVGFAVPYFFHGRKQAESAVRVSAVPVRGGAALALSWPW